MQEASDDRMQGAGDDRMQEAGDDRMQEAGDSQRVKDGERKVLTVLLVCAQLSLCTKLCITASRAGQLTAANGLAWEGWDQVLSWALLWFVAQALALRMMSCQRRYDLVDVCLSVLFLVPYIGDPFDTLKDAMLASVAMQSEPLLLRVLGMAGMAYLWILHLCFLLPAEDTMVELQRSYLPVFFLKAKREGRTPHSKWVKACSILYKQTTPTKQRAMVAEDLPQGLLAMTIAFAGHAGAFISVVNIGIPFVRIALAWWFHDRIGEQVRDWLFDEAVESYESGRSVEADEQILAFWRLLHLGLDCTSEPPWNPWIDRLREEQRRKLHRQAEEEEAEKWLGSTTLFGALLLLQLRRNPSQSEIPEKPSANALSTLLRCASRDERVQPLFIRSATGACLRNGRFAVNLWDFGIGYQIKISESKFLAQLLQQLKDVKEVELAMPGARLGDEGLKELATAIAKLERGDTGLTKLHLDLMGNKITDDGLKSLASSLAEMKGITNLSLDLDDNEREMISYDCYNKISAEGFKALAASIAKLTALTRLVLSLPAPAKKLNRQERQAAEAAEAALRASAAQLPRLTKEETHIDVGYKYIRELGDEERRLVDLIYEKPKISLW